MVKNTLPKHVKNYLESLGLDSSDRLMCEVCFSPANEIHHVEPRSSFGSKRKEEQDEPSNLIALCRRCHDKAHGVKSREIKISLKRIVSNRAFK